MSDKKTDSNVFLESGDPELQQYCLGLVTRLRAELGFDDNEPIPEQWDDSWPEGVRDLYEEYNDARERYRKVMYLQEQKRLSQFLKESNSPEGLSVEAFAWWWDRY